jgi:hypothetical protein
VSGALLAASHTVSHHLWIVFVAYCIEFISHFYEFYHYLYYVSDMTKTIGLMFCSDIEVSSDNVYS